MFTKLFGHRRGRRLEHRLWRTGTRVALGKTHGHQVRWESQRRQLGLPAPSRRLPALKRSGSDFVDGCRMLVIGVIALVQLVCWLLPRVYRIARSADRLFAWSIRRIVPVSWRPVLTKSVIGCPLCSSECKVVATRESRSTRWAVWCPSCLYSWTTVAATTVLMREQLYDLASIQAAGPPEPATVSLEEFTTPVQVEVLPFDRPVAVPDAMSSLRAEIDRVLAAYA